jgi:hypothetical protein
VQNNFAQAVILPNGKVFSRAVLLYDMQRKLYRLPYTWLQGQFVGRAPPLIVGLATCMNVHFEVWNFRRMKGDFPWKQLQNMNRWQMCAKN